MWVVLALAGFFAGAINAVAGGGTFLTFPTLVFLGIGPLAANATSTVALWPGSIASAWGYRALLREERSTLVPLLLVSLVGGWLGAVAALSTPPAVFAHLVPFLVAFGALLFTFGDGLRRMLARFGETPRWVVLVVQLPISLYGGYLGGGIGLLMLAALTLLGGRDLHRLNGLKSVLGLAINLSATAVFVASGLVEWPRAFVMGLAATIGGYAGARLALRFDVRVVKRVVIALAWAMTAAFFVKTFW